MVSPFFPQAFPVDFRRFVAGAELFLVDLGRGRLRCEVLVAQRDASEEQTLPGSIAAGLSQDLLKKWSSLNQPIWSESNFLPISISLDRLGFNQHLDGDLPWIYQRFLHPLRIWFFLWDAQLYHGPQGEIGRKKMWVGLTEKGELL